MKVIRRDNNWRHLPSRHYTARVDGCSIVFSIPSGRGTSNFEIFVDETAFAEIAGTLARRDRNKFMRIFDQALATNCITHADGGSPAT